MDPSKLPKLSNTPPPLPVPDQPSAPPPMHYASAPPGVGAEAWISLALGIVFLFWFPSASKLWNYSFNRAKFDQQWSFTSETGASIAYPKSIFFWEDLGITGFSLLLVAEGLVLWLMRRYAGMVALLMLAIGVAALNVAAIAVAGFRILPAMALVFSVYIAMYQWKIVRAMKGDRAAPMT